jgi:hypothetical protein
VLKIADPDRNQDRVFHTVEDDLGQSSNARSTGGWVSQLLKNLSSMVAVLVVVWIIDCFLDHHGVLDRDAARTRLRELWLVAVALWLLGYQVYHTWGPGRDRRRPPPAT